MATAYELAFLSNFSYKSQTGQSTRIFEISKGHNEGFKPNFLDPIEWKSKIREGKSVWAIVEDIGLYNNMYCAKFRNLKSDQIVYAFRGTRPPNSKDLIADVKHLWSRESRYIEAAKDYLKNKSLNNAIITGHSLGGFLAVSMAYYYSNLRIAAFNAPHVANPLSLIGDWWEYWFKQNFKTNKIIYYESSVEFLASFTRTKAHDLNIFLMSNVTIKRVYFAGLHDLGPMLRQLRKRKESINWNAIK